MTLNTQTNLGSQPLQVVDLPAVNNPCGVDELNCSTGSCLFLILPQCQLRPTFLRDERIITCYYKLSALIFSLTRIEALDRLPVLYTRVVTGSECNLIRLRIWLACHIYRLFPSV